MRWRERRLFRREPQNTDHEALSEISVLKMPIERAYSGFDFHAAGLIGAEEETCAARGFLKESSRKVHRSVHTGIEEGSLEQPRRERHGQRKRVSAGIGHPIVWFQDELI